MRTDQTPFWSFDFDIALFTERLTFISKTSGTKERSYYKHWDRSKRLGIMFMLMNIASNIKTTLSNTENAKDFLKFVEESYQFGDKSFARTIMGISTSMNLDGSRTMHKHVIEMTNVAARLKSLEMKVE